MQIHFVMQANRFAVDVVTQSTTRVIADARCLPRDVQGYYRSSAGSEAGERSDTVSTRRISVSRLNP